MDLPRPTGGGRQKRGASKSLGGDGKPLIDAGPTAQLQIKRRARRKPSRSKDRLASMVIIIAYLRHENDRVPTDAEISRLFGLSSGVVAGYRRRLAKLGKR
jgi:hypothetical protein